MDISVHKDIGYDVMEHLHGAIIDSTLVDINENGCYQKLFLANGGAIHYTKWREGTMPFYIILYNANGNYIFELDLSMLLYSDDKFEWNLKKPQNKRTLSVIQEQLGEVGAFSDDYVELIKSQKANLESGVNTPRNGFQFLSAVNWISLTERLTQLILSVFEVHDVPVVLADNNAHEEAQNDDPDVFLNQSRRARKGQRRLRLKLLQLYENKCAITGYAPTEVLEAAHISSHSTSGINHSDNGLLLRADIHSLFDSNLLRICPDNLTVLIDSSLKNTPYWKLQGKHLRKRVDGSNPAKEYLIERWNLHVMVPE